ncbi:chemotaxis protein CheW [Stenomitos frigidus]|uniref:Chemotaxis protein CheW n=1 Tax=Stenomitos frigidus ULC18 TaxID=2107698 RepID=A0A2T1DT28_9CYAN|nr:chemotaxis protein CheW [Stenomitos frigidus]PSB23544.1 chemotaxis protein CheW [Stenomitos frigidus ULC18]
MSDAVSLSDSHALATRTQEQAIVSANDTKEQFLRLHLVPDTKVLLPIQQVAEVLTIPAGQIVPIPHMPACVMGVYNWRGEVLWMVDLGHLCGLIPYYQQAVRVAHTAVVLQGQDKKSTQKSQTLGLVLDRVEDVEWCDPKVIQPLSSSTLTSELAALLRGYWWKSDDAMLAVLEAEAIIATISRL